MKEYIAQAINNPQIQPQNGQNSSFDPMVMVWLGLGGIGTFLASFVPKFLDSAILTKSVDGKINQKQAETNAAVAEKLTRVNVDKQEAETFIDLSNTVADIARKGVDNSTDYNKELLNIVRESISASQLNAESRNCLVKATENLVEAQKEAIRASGNIAEGMHKLAQAQEVARKEILESHELAISEFKTTCDRISKQMYTTEKAVKEEFAEAIAQLRKDIKELENKIITAIRT